MFPAAPRSLEGSECPGRAPALAPKGTERCPGTVEMQGPGASGAELFTIPGSFMKLTLSRLYVRSLSRTKCVSVSKGKPL